MCYDLIMQIQPENPRQRNGVLAFLGQIYDITKQRKNYD